MEAKSSSFENYVLPYDTNTNNFVKFIAINIIFAPLLKHALWLVLFRVATLYVLQGRKVRIQETRSGLFGVICYFFGGQRGRITAYLMSFAFLAVSMLTEYGFGSVLVDTVRTVQIFTPVTFRKLTLSTIVDPIQRPENWFIRQSSACMGELETCNFKDHMMLRGDLTRSTMLEECMSFARNMSQRAARARYVKACREAGRSMDPIMGYMVLNWTKPVEFREGALSFPDREVLWVGNSKKDIKSRGFILGAGWDCNHPDRIVMLPRCKTYLPSFSLALRVLHGSLGKVLGDVQPVLLDGDGASYASWRGDRNLVCLSIRKVRATCER